MFIILRCTVSRMTIKTASVSVCDLDMRRKRRMSVSVCCVTKYSGQAFFLFFFFDSHQLFHQFLLYLVKFVEWFAVFLTLMNVC